MVNGALGTFMGMGNSRVLTRKVGERVYTIGGRKAKMEISEA
jgi:hypothetical protein